MTGRPALRAAVTVVVAAVALLSAGCGGSTDATPSASGPTSVAPDRDCGPARTPEPLVPQVVRELPHDPTAFTQGLVLVDGTLYESTGLEGGSGVRAVDAGSGRVLAATPLDPTWFGEGLAAVGTDRLVQLTWKDGVAVLWQRPADPSQPLTEVERFRYTGEGWGLTTFSAGTLAMSDGSDRITERDPDDFSVTGRWRVRRADGAADQLNELEWDGEHLWANRWQTSEIVRVDRDCHDVDAVVDASTLVERAGTLSGGSPVDVLNGIAHVPGTDRYLVTGKLWPVAFEVRFVPA